MSLAERFREEGLKEGMEKGMGKTLSRTAVKLLTKKFGNIPADLKEKIIKLDSLTLEIIVDNIFDYENLDDIKKYID